MSKLPNKLDGDAKGSNEFMNQYEESKTHKLELRWTGSGYVGTYEEDGEIKELTGDEIVDIFEELDI